MYFGSVKFFKHLIYIIVFGWIAAATFLAVFFGIKYLNETRKTTDAYSSSEDLSEDKIIIPDGTSFERLFLVMAAKGYSTEEMLSLIEETDRDAFRQFVKDYISSDVSLLEDINADNGNNITNGAPDPDATDSAAEYTKLYPDLYAEDPPTSFKEDNGTIYLTFDDGPSENTEDILAILDRYDIKATFFFCGGTDDAAKERMKAVADAGHTVGIHSISHDYKKIYESVESYLADFNDTYNCIYEATGVKPQIFRFPGGSINNYNRFTYMQIIAEMTRRGFVYYDWNVSGEDATKGADWTSIYNNVLTGIENNSADRAIVLLHDSQDKYATVTVLEDVIDELLAQGYTFGQLDPTVRPINFSYVD